MANSQLIRTDNHLADADAFYEQLLNAHEGLSREASEALNARLILVMANQIGSLQVLSQCIQAAQSSKESKAAQVDQAIKAAA